MSNTASNRVLRSSTEKRSHGRRQGRNGNYPRAVASLSSSITQLGAALAGLAAIAYVVGYLYLRAYYGGNSLWTLSLYGLGDIIRAGALITSAAALTGIWTIMQLGAGTWTPKHLEKWRLLPLVFGGFLVGLSLLPKVILPAHVALNASIGGGICLAVSAGFDIGRLVALLKESGSQWKSTHFDMLWGVYMAAVVLAPPVVGASQSQIDFDPKLSELPFVSKMGFKDQLRLVAALDDKLLVVSLSDVADKRAYRLLAATDGWTIGRQVPEVQPVSVRSK